MDITVGQVVEFIEGQRFMCALCLGKKGIRYHVLTHLGRETNLSRNRFLHVSSQRINAATRDLKIKALEEIHNQRDRLKDQIDVKELWELIQGERQEWTPRALADIALPSPSDSDHEAALIRAVIEDHTFFKFKEQFIVAQPEEVIEKVMTQRAKEQENMNRLARGSQWLESLWADGDLRPGRLKPPDTSDPYVTYWISAIQDFCVAGDESKEAQNVRSLFRQMGLTRTTDPFTTLVRAGIWSEDENVDLLRHEVSTEFSPEVLEQANQLALKPMDLDREDLAELHTVTIDGPESLDLDDALSFREVDNGWEIGVHITDIGLQMDLGPGLFEEAVQRATTLYLPDRIIPMLPETLSQEAWSLKAGVPRQAISHFIRLDSEGNLLDCRITRSTIRVHERLTYRDVEAQLAEEGPLKTVHALCLRLQERRIRNGALPLPIPELIISAKNGDVHIDQIRPGPARFLVAECMILANKVAAEFLRDRQIPGLFRSQPEPRERIISGDETDLLANFRQRRLINRVQLGPEPAPHHGLGLDAYTTITSPLRRALDLLMQQQIGTVLQTGKPLHSEADLQRLSMELQDGLSRAAAVRQSRNRYWILKHIEQRKQTPLQGWILERSGDKILAVLTDYLIIVDLPRRPGTEITPDQLVSLRIKKVSPRENILKVDWGDARP